MLDQMLQGVQNITPTTTPETLSVVPGIGLVGMGSPTGMPQSNHTRPVKFLRQIIPSHIVSTYSHPFHLLLQALPPPINPPTKVFLICPNLMLRERF